MASPFSKNEPSLYISHVHNNITKARIQKVFESLEFGTIKTEDIDLVNKTSRDGKKHKQAFIHFAEWSTSEEASDFRSDMMNGVKREVEYEEMKNSPIDEATGVAKNWWYWRVEKSHVPRPDRSEKKSTATTKTKIQPRIRTTKTHPGKTHPASEAYNYSDEIATLKRQVTQIGLLQAKMEQILATTAPLWQMEEADEATATTPEYTPSSPMYMPEPPDEIPSPLTT